MDKFNYNSKFPGGLTRQEATIVYVVCVLEDLKRELQVRGPDVTTEEAWQLFRELEAIEFMPTKQDAAEVLAALAMI